VTSSAGVASGQLREIANYRRVIADLSDAEPRPLAMGLSGPILGGLAKTVAKSSVPSAQWQRSPVKDQSARLTLVRTS
jgi:hypothetical protein